MAALPVKHSANATSMTYGADEYRLFFTIVAQAAAAPIVAAVNDATNPPCAAEVNTITRTSAGLYVVTLYDCYYAVAYAGAEIDDTLALGNWATIGTWANLQTSTPATFNLNCWENLAGTNTAYDPALGTAIRIALVLKKSPSGAKA
jgi:hypothetical protein